LLGLRKADVIDIKTQDLGKIVEVF
jgi:hypothetical protein